MKKLVVIAIMSCVALAGCSSKSKDSDNFYRISDSNVIDYITESNNIEKCLPSGVRLKSLNDAERKVLNGTKLDALTNIVGKKAPSIWYASSFYGGDKKANEYFETKLIELAHKKTSVTEAECSSMKNKFAQRLSKFMAQEAYENSPAGRAAIAQENMQAMQAMQMMQGIGGLIQQPAQLDYWQQLQIEKVRAKAQQGPTQTNTNCYYIGNNLHCDSTHY